MLSGTPTLPSGAGTAKTGTWSLAFSSSASFPGFVTLNLLLLNLRLVKWLTLCWGGGSRAGDRGAESPPCRVPLGHHGWIRGSCWSWMCHRMGWLCMLRLIMSPSHTALRTAWPPQQCRDMAQSSPAPTPVLKELVPEGPEPQDPLSCPPSRPLLPVLSPQNASGLHCQ